MQAVFIRLQHLQLKALGAGEARGTAGEENRIAPTAITPANALRVMGLQTVPTQRDLTCVGSNG